MDPRAVVAQSDFDQSSKEVLRDPFLTCTIHDHDVPGRQQSGAINIRFPAERGEPSDQIFAQYKHHAGSAHFCWQFGGQWRRETPPGVKSQRVIGFPCKGVGLIHECVCKGLRSGMRISQRVMLFLFMWCGLS